MELMGSESKEKMNNFIDAENEVLKNENDYDSDEEVDFKVHESDSPSDFEQNAMSDEDTESLTGSLDGVTGGDEYEMTGDDTEYHSDSLTRHIPQDKLEMLALRRHLDALSDQVVQNDYLVIQSREELGKCRENIQSLEKEIQKVEKEIECHESKGNKAPIFRLKSHYTKLCCELDTERNVEMAIRDRLDSAEYSLSLAKMEQGRFLLAGEELEKEEQFEVKNKSEASAMRIRKENIAAMAADKRRRTREKENITALRERERKHRHAINMAKKSREQASKFLKETMTRVRLKEAEDEDHHRADMEIRIKNLLSLKNNIEKNKDSLRTIEARRDVMRQEQEQRDQLEREEILIDGLNPDEILTRRKRIRQFEKDKETLEKRQRERQIEIADKLLREEKQMKKRFQQQPQLWPEKHRDRNKRFAKRRTKSKPFKVYSGSSSMEYSADAEDAGGGFLPSKLVPVSSDDEDDFSPFGHTSRDEEKDGDSDHDEDDLVEPEFPGLWNDFEDSANKKFDKCQTERKLTVNNVMSKTEQEIRERSLKKQRDNIVQKQVAVGREFKGQAFYSKPEVIIFKDFDVGKSYRKKIILTNVSFTQNFCKYVGMSEQLLDFIDVIYDPPGVMSAGLTCHFAVLFKPMLNEDLIGQIDFLAQTGPFSVPVKCLSKKCQVSVDNEHINFGSQILGESCKKIVTLINDGALGTRFYVKKCLSSVDVNPQLFKETDRNVVENVGDDFNKQEKLKELDDKTQDKKHFEKQNIEDKQEMEDLPSPIHKKSDDIVTEEFTLGEVKCGELRPQTSFQLEVIFAPLKPGDSTCSFEITFEDGELLPIIINVHGTCIDVPVWVEREIVDLKICMYDRLYQDAIVINNRATSALRLKFEVNKDVSNHLELLPKTAYIQAQSQFSAQLKFLPRKTLSKDCPNYFNAETGILRAPLTICVADKTRPVQFTVHAIVTPSDIEFNVSKIDFGYCTTVESVKQTITMTNKSVLAQMYGFCRVPECLEVQPNDGFGTLLPLESFDVDVIFSPKNAQEYNMDLVCKNGIGTEFSISCKGTGVYPPLKLSVSSISFRATSIGDSSIAKLKVTSHLTDENGFTHEVPRIGKGPVAKFGPTTFEFVVPSGSPINISPAVGVVMPGKSCNIDVTFSPQLLEEEIIQETFRIAGKMVKRKISEESSNKMEETIPTTSPSNVKKQLTKKGGKKSGKDSPKRRQTSSVASKTQSTSMKTSTDDKDMKGSDEYSAAQLSLLKNFENQFNSYSIPCFVASGESSGPGTLEYSVYNTLFLKVHCPAIRPHLVVVSNYGRSSVDFGPVSVGQREVRDLTIQNISSYTLELSTSILDPHGPFMLLNVNRTLESMESISCCISFSPQSAEEFYEVLEFNCVRSSLHVKLRGKGVTPVVASNVENSVIDFGYALVHDSVTAMFKLENNSELRVSYDLNFASLSKSKRSILRNTMPFERESPAIGCSNYSGQVVFDCVPSSGNIEPGKSQDIFVSFTPDHASEYFADELSIEVNNDVSEIVRLRARASPTLMYLQGWDELRQQEKSLTEITSEHEEGSPLQKKVLLMFKSESKQGESFKPIERRILVGCIKSSMVNRKSCEFVFDSLKECNEKGFSFDPIKSSVESGAKKDIVFRWQPTADHDTNAVVSASTTVTVKGETVTQYHVLLRGIVVSQE